MEELNTRVMRGYGTSRADLFATLDRPSLQLLSADPYVFARPIRLWLSAPAWPRTTTPKSTVRGVPSPLP